MNAQIVLFNHAEHDALHAIRYLRQSAPDLCGIVLAVPAIEEDVIACIEAGAVGFVTADQPLSHLVDVITSVARGETTCSPPVTAMLLRRLAALSANHHAEPATGRLTARERTVLAHIERGLSNKEIASALFIELSTVKNHVHNILKKLRVGRRDEESGHCGPAINTRGCPCRERCRSGVLTTRFRVGPSGQCPSGV